MKTNNYGIHSIVYMRKFLDDEAQEHMISIQRKLVHEQHKIGMTRSRYCEEDVVIVDSLKGG